MLGSSFPLGRIMGVDVRLHLSFPVLLVAAVAYGAWATGNPVRGFGLWAALLFAVVVREVARAIAAAYLGLRLRALFLLPVGGVMALAPQSGPQPSMRAITLAAPITNIGFGLLFLGISYACAPGVQLLTQPWISASHVLRSFIWTQFIVAVVNMLPAAILPTRQMIGVKASSTATPTRSSGFNLLTGVAVAMIISGALTLNLFLLILGLFAMVYSQVRTQAASPESPATDGLRVNEVMLTDSIIISNSDTLRGALAQAVHSVQDVFPVVRGDRLVGSVSRQTLAERLQYEGDGYLQGIMNRDLQTAGPTELLSVALRRAASRGTSEFIPVVEDGRMLGILTPQGLARAMQHANLTRTPKRARGGDVIE